MKRNWKKVALVTSGVAIVVAAFVAGRALAGGVPATNALSYAGTLADATGTPLTGAHNVEVKLWNVASGGTMALCTTNPQAVVLQGGRFSLPLPDGCTMIVGTNPDVWVEVVDNGMSLGRTKVGAVPYAVEASHAITADNSTNAAAATGALATTLGSLAPKAGVATITNWTAYTPTVGANGGSTIVNATSNGYWRRVGDTAEVRIFTVFNGPPVDSSNAAVTGVLVWSLPTGVTLDTTKANRGLLGSGTMSGNGNQTYICTGALTGGNTVYSYCDSSGITFPGNTSVVRNGVPFTIAANDSAAFDIRIPVVGWTINSP